MKKKSLAIMMSVLLTLSIMGGCSKKASKENDNSSTAMINSNSSVENSSDNSTDQSGSNVSDNSNTENASGNVQVAGSSPDNGVNQNNTDNVSLTKVSLPKAADALKSVPSKLRGTTIKYYDWYDLENTGEKKAIEEFTKATGIKVEIMPSNYETFYEDLIRMVAAGKSPDCARLNGNSIYKIKDSFQPIESATGFDFSGGEWEQTTVKDYTFNGKKYAVNVSNTAFIQSNCVYYNIKTFKKFKIEEPFTLWQQGKWNWSKFEEICSQYKQKVNGAIAGATLCPMEVIAQCKGADLFSYDSNSSKYVNTSLDPTFLEAWRFTSRMVKDGLLSKDANQVDDFIGGTIGMFVSSSDSCMKGNKTLLKLSAKGNLGYCPMPKDSNNDYQPIAEYTAFGVCKGAKNAAAVPYFLRYVLDIDTYGGDSYYANDQAKTTFKETMKNTKRSIYYGDIVTADLGEENTIISFDLYHNVFPENISTFLEGKKNVLDTATSRANECISNMR